MEMTLVCLKLETGAVVTETVDVPILNVISCGVVGLSGVREPCGI